MNVFVCDEASPRDMAHVSRSCWTLCAICALSPKSFSLQLLGFCRPSISPQLIYKAIIFTAQHGTVQYSTVQSSKAELSAAQYSTVKYSEFQFNKGVDMTMDRGGGMGVGVDRAVDSDVGSGRSKERGRVRGAVTVP